VIKLFLSISARNGI